ncbi:MAG TPA: exodeoxyribonuclease VII large subunit, partial [Candidatus Eisenbacteria bacterium]
MSRRARAVPLETAAGEPRVWTVKELVDVINEALDSSLPAVTVQGEITGLKTVPAGHIYFGLKDAEAQIRVAFFRNRIRRDQAPLRDGLAVQVEGSLDFYGPRGELSLVADRVFPLGYGALQARFDALKRKLLAEGLFDESRKRALPRFPTRVGIVTSPSGAAIRDMLRLLRQRAPYVAVTLAPVAVQGEEAAEQVADAIACFNEWGGADVLIVGRGGGSIEDLWAFNEEIVVRAIAASRVPVISAVGHEVDWTLADFAADVRAATPTHAAQQVAPSREEIEARLDDLAKHARERLRRDVAQARTRLDGLRYHRALHDPARRVRDGHRGVDEFADRLERGLRDWVVRQSHRLDAWTGGLRAHTPARSLERARERVATLQRQAERAARLAVGRGRESVAARGTLL